MRRRLFRGALVILAVIGFVPALKVGWVVVTGVIRFASPDAGVPLSTDGPNQVVLAIPAMT